MKLEDLKSSHFACIYRIDFPDGKFYVGQTRDIGSRVLIYESCIDGFSSSKKKPVSEAVRKHGLGSLEFSILTKVSSDTKADLLICLSILEIKYIRETNALVDGLNVSCGGECLGVPIEYITTNKDSITSYYAPNKAILLYGIDGNFIREYESISKCQYDIGMIEKDASDFIDKRRIFDKKYILRSKKYDYIPQDIATYDFKIKDRIKYNTIIEDRVIVRDRIVIRDKYTVLKYDMDGNFCGEYASNTIACKSFTSQKNIPCGKYVKGFVLFRKPADGDYPLKIESSSILAGKAMGDYYKPADELPDNGPSPTKKRGAPYVRKGWGKHENLINDFEVGQYSLDGEQISMFGSIRDASDKTGLGYAGIWSCVFGRTKKSQGFIWRKIE